MRLGDIQFHSCGYCINKTKKQGEKGDIYALIMLHLLIGVFLIRKKILSLDKSLNSYLSKYVTVAYVVKHQTVKIWLLLVRTQSGTPRDKLF